jgi:type IV pilus assembly protein PilA
MKKLFNKKGFTLMEMLIVVAIIVILVVISVPMFSVPLDSAKQATDAANFRAAKSAYFVQTLNGADAPINDSDDYYYDCDEGKFVTYEDEDDIPAGSKGQCGNHSGDYITIEGGKVVWSDDEHKNKCN